MGRSINIPAHKDRVQYFLDQVRYGSKYQRHSTTLKKEFDELFDSLPDSLKSSNAYWMQKLYTYKIDIEQYLKTD